MAGRRERLVSLVLFSGTSVYSPSAGFNVLPQILTYPIQSTPTPFDPRFGRDARTQLDSDVRVIGVFMPVLDVFVGLAINV